jgi:hypothetical protein
VPVAFTIAVSDPNSNPLTSRIVSQAAHGTVALAGTTGTYFPEPGFVGTDNFTFAAWDGSRDSNLATGRVAVTYADQDADGVPDWWMRLHFGHADGQAADLSRATDDPDGDGIDNAGEYRGDTDPRDGRSVVAIFELARTSNAQARLMIASHLGQRFAVDSTPSLLADWVSRASNVWGRSDATPWTDPAAVTTAQFYRVRATMP